MVFLPCIYLFTTLYSRIIVISYILRLNFVFVIRYIFPLISSFSICQGYCIKNCKTSAVFIQKFYISARFNSTVCSCYFCKKCNYFISRLYRYICCKVYSRICFCHRNNNFLLHTCFKYFFVVCLSLFIWSKYHFIACISYRRNYISVFPSETSVLGTSACKSTFR